MEVYFLRHGLADGPLLQNPMEDSKRELTEAGIQEMRRAAIGMKKLGLRFQDIFSSPYVRAKQTAEIVAQALGHKEGLQFSEDLVPHAEPGKFSVLLGAAEDDNRVLVVGHQPHLGRLISLLIGGDEDVLLDIKKGSLCRVDIGEGAFSADFEGAQGNLKWLLTAEQLSLIS